MATLPYLEPQTSNHNVFNSNNHNSYKNFSLVAYDSISNSLIPDESEILKKELYNNGTCEYQCSQTREEKQRCDLIDSTSSGSQKVVGWNLDKNEGSVSQNHSYTWRDNNSSRRDVVRINMGPTTTEATQLLINDFLTTFERTCEMYGPGRVLQVPEINRFVSILQRAEMPPGPLAKAVAGDVAKYLALQMLLQQSPTPVQVSGKGSAIQRSSNNGNTEMRPPSPKRTKSTRAVRRSAFLRKSINNGDSSSSDDEVNKDFQLQHPDTPNDSSDEEYQSFGARNTAMPCIYARSAQSFTQHEAVTANINLPQQLLTLQGRHYIVATTRFNWDDAGWLLYTFLKGFQNGCVIMNVAELCTDADISKQLNEQHKSSQTSFVPGYHKLAHILDMHNIRKKTTLVKERIFEMGKSLAFSKAYIFAVKKTLDNHVRRPFNKMTLNISPNFKQQKLSFRPPLITYILKECKNNPIMYQKLQKTCKQFANQLQTISIYSIQYNFESPRGWFYRQSCISCFESIDYAARQRYQICLQKNYLDILKLKNTFWVFGEIDVAGFGRQTNCASALVSKLEQCDAHSVKLSDQTLTAAELTKLVTCASTIVLINVKILDEAKQILPLENILDCLPNAVRDLTISLRNDEALYTNETAKLLHGFLKQSTSLLFFTFLGIKVNIDIQKLGSLFSSEALGNIRKVFGFANFQQVGNAVKENLFNRRIQNLKITFDR